MRTTNTLYSETDYKTCLERIHKLTYDLRPQWGKMSAAQMLAHCSEVQEVINGKPLKNTPLIVKLFKGMARNSMLSKKPYKKNMKTHPQYIIKSKADFETEKTRLLAAIEEFFSLDKEKAKKIKHHLFGAMTLDQKGWASYKHLNYHLVQFGV